MKKFFYLFGGAFALISTTSCKKDYDCECSTTVTGNGVTITGDARTTTLKEATKSQAKANCLNRETEYSNSYTNYYGNTITYTYAYTTNCELK